MSRYIDADKLLEDLGLRKGITVDEIINGIPEKGIRPMDEPHCWFFLSIILAPTADVVEVVRCKDCKECEERKTANYLSFLFCKSNHHSVAENDYCSYGERREDGEIC